MKDDVVIKDGIVIPGRELEITASRAGGPGGQHVNKTSTRITVRWNINQTKALDEVEKFRVLNKLKNELTADGDLIIHAGSARSQLQNKKAALEQLAKRVYKALQVPKKRKKTKVSKTAKETRLKEKKQRSKIKQMRSEKF